MDRDGASFRDRRDAGRALAQRLAAYANRSDVSVLALPRGGVPVAYEVACALNLPLDVFVVRKLGVPGREELAMGALASGGIRVENDDVIAKLGIPEYVVDAVASQERVELERRERLYRQGRASPDVIGKTVILIDDGLATGATMHAAVDALRRNAPARIVIAVPVASRETCDRLHQEVDEVICAMTPEPFFAVGSGYDDFEQTTDDEVRELLADAREVCALRAPGRAETPTDRALRGRAEVLRGRAHDYDRLVALAADARFVLLGEATHGTHEFYRERAEITKRLILEKGYRAVAVEADWPDAYRVNRYVRGQSDDRDANDALLGFRRFPSWMWRNTDVVEFVEWLRRYNDAQPADSLKVGFYGLDLYSLHTSMKEVLHYLEKVDPNAAKQTLERYACFDHYGEDMQVYGLATGTGLAKPCEVGVVTQLVESQRRSMDAARRAGAWQDEEHFYAEQNARLVENAEAYYRAMFLEEVSSWNLRDRHMAETLDSVAAFLARRGGVAKVAVWAHNSHLGDARATDMSRRGEWNLGQLAREKYGYEAVTIGFTTHRGTVTAASNWGSPAERKQVLPALPDSYEALFHDVGRKRFLLTMRDDAALAQCLREPRLERAIGVIYRPATERLSHYFRAWIADQFDAVLHFDETRALQPLERNVEWTAGETETFPFSL